MKVEGINRPVVLTILRGIIKIIRKSVIVMLQWLT